MEEVLQPLYTCGICEEPVNYPKNLQCQHVFCHECLVVYITLYFGKASFPCPLCSFKHAPEQPDTEVGEELMLTIEEASLTRDLLQFYGNGEESQQVYSTDGINRVACPLHDGSKCAYYCPTCNTVACGHCKETIHRNCDLRQIDKNMRMSAYNKIRQISSEFENFRSDVDVVYGKLTEKLENLFLEDEDMLSTVNSYYVDLTDKVVKYLERQKEQVLRKAKELKENEREHLQQDVLVCSSLVTSLDIRQNLASAVQVRSSVNSSENMILGGHLEHSLERYKTMLPNLQLDSSKSFDLKFLINTELEDRLSDSDIVKIEVIDSCHAGSVAISFGDDEETSSQNGTAEHGHSGLRGAVGGDAPGSDESTPAADHVSLVRQHAQHEGDGSPPPPPEDEEPPPSYRNVVRQSFIQRRRPFGTSVVRQSSPLASPLPVLQQEDHPRPIQPSGNDPPPLQPSAPPLQPSGPLPRGYTSQREVHDSLPSYHSTPPQTLPGPRSSLAMVKFRSKLELSGLEDYKLPSIVGIATVGKYFVVLDQSNHNLKLVSQSAGVLNVYDFGSMVEPWDVASISDSECVVTAPKSGRLLFVAYPPSLDGRMSTLRHTMDVGKYISIAYCKRKQILIGGRSPPFSAARIDIITMQGYISKKINLENLLAVPRHLLITDSDVLVVCDLNKHHVISYNLNHHRAAFTEVTGIGATSLRDPQGVAALPGMTTVLIMDGLSGNLFMTKSSCTTTRLLDHKINVEELGNPEMKYSISVSSDAATLAVTYTKGSVTFYDMRYT